MKKVIATIFVACAVLIFASTARADWPSWPDNTQITWEMFQAFQDSIESSIADSLANTPRISESITNITIGAIKLTLDGDDLTNGLYSGLVDSITAGEGLALGNLIYQEPTTGNWLKAQADSAASVGAQAIALGTINAAAVGLVLRYGYLKVDAWTTVETSGATVYVDDDTAGLPTTTVPPDAGDVVFGVGSCVGTDLLFFNPPPPIYYVVRK